MRPDEGVHTLTAVAASKNLFVIPNNVVLNDTNRKSQGQIDRHRGDHRYSRKREAQNAVNLRSAACYAARRYAASRIVEYRAY